MPTNSAKSKLIWKHNSFFGHVRMDMAHMNAIIYSETATIRAKLMATDIRSKLEALAIELKERVDAHP